MLCQVLPLTGRIRRTGNARNVEKPTPVSSYKCKDCGKVYVKEACTKRHAKTDHVGTNLEHDEEFIAMMVKKSAVVKQMPHDVPPEECVAEHDGKNFVLQYWQCALFLGLLAYTFNEARKCGDGKRLITLYKYLFLLFKLEGGDEICLIYISAPLSGSLSSPRKDGI
eukprot:gene12429-13714_t